MNKTPNERTENTTILSQKAKSRHPYMMSNSKEETIRRMRGFSERAAKFLEKLNADREKNAN